MRETLKQRERRCAGRVTIGSTSYPCQEPATVLGRDGNWRCRTCAAKSHNERA